MAARPKFSALRAAVYRYRRSNLSRPAEPPEAAYNRLTAEMRERIVSMWEELRAQRSPQPQTNSGSGSAPEKH